MGVFFRTGSLRVPGIGKPLTEQGKANAGHTPQKPESRGTAPVNFIKSEIFNTFQNNLSALIK